MADELTKQSVDEFINVVLSQNPTYAGARVETGEGVALRFTVTSKIGRLECLYPLEPIVIELLRKYPRESHYYTAHSMLLRIIEDLPLGLQIGMTNVGESAALHTQEAIDVIKAQNAFDATKGKKLRGAVKGKLPSIQSGQESVAKKRRKETLERMDALNRQLVDPVGKGPKGIVTSERLSVVVSMLLSEETRVTDINVKLLANRAGCSDSAVYKCLDGLGLKLPAFLERFSQ